MNLHLTHASLKHTLDDEENAQDIRYTMSTGADIVSYTESQWIHPVFRRVTENSDYRFVPTGAYGDVFIVRTGGKNPLRVKDRGSIKVHPADTSLDKGEGRHPAGFISWVHCKMGEEDIWYHTGHWMSKLDMSRERVKQHNMSSQQMVAQVRKHGKGADLAFFSGDVNSDDRPGEQDQLADINRIFHQNGLVTIWDEFRVYPATAWRTTCDVIGSYDPDGRVKGTRYKVHPKQNTDHRIISAWYDIEKRTKKHGGGGNDTTPTPGDTSGNPADDDRYTHGKLVSWKDYRDQSVYDLPQAVDDSAGYRHGDTVDD